MSMLDECCQRPLGSIIHEPAAMAAVAASPIASERHSRRAANQSRPMPGVTLVISAKPHTNGKRKPRTIVKCEDEAHVAAPQLEECDRQDQSANRTGPVSTSRTPIIMAVHSPRNCGQGMEEQRAE